MLSVENLTEEQLKHALDPASPNTLVPSLAAYYDIHEDAFKLLYNGCPVNIQIRAKDYHEECKKLTLEIFGLVRKLCEIHKAENLEPPVIETTA